MPTTHTTDTALTASQQTASAHDASDYIGEDELHADCVRVRLHRLSHGIYAVEIHGADRDFTFEDSVARAVADRIGGKVRTSGCGNGITVIAIGFRARAGFVKVNQL